MGKTPAGQVDGSETGRAPDRALIAVNFPPLCSRTTISDQYRLRSVELTDLSDGERKATFPAESTT